MCGIAGIISQTQSLDYVAIENQSGIQVSYVYDNADNPTYFFVKITNTSTAEHTVEYQLNDAKAGKVSQSYAPLKLKAGESFIANDMTMAIPITRETKLSDYTASLTIKK